MTTVTEKRATGAPNGALSADQLLVLHLVNGVAQSQRVRVFLVGGVVRDLLRGFSVQDKDLDLIVEGDAGKFAEACLPTLGGSVKHFERFFTAKIVAPTTVPRVAEIDFASTREEVYASPGALPTVSPVPNIELDLRRRDFSVNSIALPIGAVLADARASTLSKSVIDPFLGLADLTHGVVRALHEGSFIDDPTRIFRAARYVARLGGVLSSDTQRWLDEAVRRRVLATLSVFRVVMEIKKLASERRWLSAAQILDSWKVWAGLWSSDERSPSESLSHWRGWDNVWSKKTPGDSPFERLPAPVVQRALLALFAPSDAGDLEAWAKSLQLSRSERLSLMESIRWMRKVREQGLKDAKPDGPCGALLMLGQLDSQVELHRATAHGLMPVLLSPQE